VSVDLVVFLCVRVCRVLVLGSLMEFLEDGGFLTI